MEMFSVAEFVAAERGDHAAVDDNRDPVAEQDQLAEVRRDDEHAGAAPSRIPDETIDFLARADVDADSRLVEQQDARARIVPFGEDHLLLVASGEIADAGRRARRLDRQAIDRRLRLLGFGATPNPARPREMRQPGQAEISLDRMVEHQSLRLPIFRHQRDAFFDCLGRASHVLRQRRRGGVRLLQWDAARRSSQESRCARCRSGQQGRGSPHPSARGRRHGGGR